MPKHVGIVAAAIAGMPRGSIDGLLGKGAPERSAAASLGLTRDPPAVFVETDLGKIAYAAYRAITDDCLLPQWEEMGADLRLAWTAAAEAVAEEVSDDYY